MDKKLTKNELEQRIQELEREMAECKRMDKVLQESRKVLARAQEIAQMGNWEWNIDTDKITCSDELYRIYDLEHMKGRLTYDVLMERIHPEDREYHNKHTDNWLKNKGGDPFEYRILRSDGSVRYIYGPGEVLCDDKGKPIKMFGVIQDITERKWAEEVLKETEEKYKRLIETANDAIFIADTKTGKIINVNKKAENLLDLPAKKIIGMNQIQLYPKEEVKYYRKMFLEAVNKNKNITNIEAYVVDKAGHKIPVEISASVTTIGGKKVIQGIFRDLTERKKAEGKLKEEADLRRVLLDNMPCIALILKKGTREIVACNKVAGQLGAAPGITCFSAFAKRRVPCPFCLAPETWADGKMRHLEVEYEGVHYRGHWVSLTEDLYLHYIFNLTEHKKTEDQIRKLSHAVEQSPIAIMITDTIGNIEYVNPQFTRLTGFSSEEVLGNTPGFLKSGEQPDGFYKQLWDTIRSGEVWHGEFHNKRKNGEVYWEAVSISPIMDEGGDITHFVAVKEDITDRKKTEEVLRKAHEELEQRVKERTAELKQTFDQLLHAEKLSAIGKLSASIAHEFNNPLFGIRSVLEGIKKRGSFDKDDSELLDLGIRECNRIKDLIVSLQEFNRPTSGEMKPMNVQQAIEDMLLLCKKEFNTRKITVEECYTTDLPEIQAVEDQIKQVILNLLRNAEEAIPEEGGTIKVATKRFKKKVAIQIHDSGVGIRAKDKNKIFDPFYSTKSSVKGAGLGLSVSYGIIKRHGGGVEVESRPNKGTTFTVTLPMKGNI